MRGRVTSRERACVAWTASSTQHFESSARSHRVGTHAREKIDQRVDISGIHLGRCRRHLGNLLPRRAHGISHCAVVSCRLRARWARSLALLREETCREGGHHSINPVVPSADLVTDFASARGRARCEPARHRPGDAAGKSESFVRGEFRGDCRCDGEGVRAVR